MSSVIMSGMSMMPAGEHIHTTSVKKVALRELPNDSGNIINRPPANAAISKDVQNPDSTKLLASHSVKLVGSKRLQPDGPENPSSFQQHGNDTHINLANVPVRLVDSERQQPEDPANPSGHQTQGTQVTKLAELIEKLRRSKRQKSDGFASASISWIESEIGPDINHVYIRRKLETGQAKADISGSANNIESPEQRMSSNILTMEPDLDLNQNQEPKGDSLQVCAPDLMDYLGSPSWGASDSYTNEKNNYELVAPETHDSTSKTPVVCDSFDANGQNWKERFLRLQVFLKNCDQSSQEDYVKTLRALSAAGRSKHAVELEKRAIHLLLEEGKELQRMKVLNVLGKSLQNDQPMLPTESPSPLQVHLR